MKCSICMSTYNRPNLLKKTLDSIFSQGVPFSYEVIVVDDGSPSQDTQHLCQKLPVRYSRIERKPGFRFNPAIARNAAYRLAEGDIIICQSDDVIHGEGTLRRLVDDLGDREFLIATVQNVNVNMKPIGLRGYGRRCECITLLTGPENPRPLFFLGSLRRRDLYAVGGNDESLVGREDVFFADCLIRGLRLTPRFLQATGYHQDHDRPNHTENVRRLSTESYSRRIAACQITGQWTTTSGSWPYPLPEAPLRSRSLRVGE